ncbi:hypothetical protein ColTof3_06445 [Colletotrichum tofieldiae]|nr:hypothetical protein ColTof3_06445 [Colletotrichum tofieldiae]
MYSKWYLQHVNRDLNEHTQEPPWSGRWVTLDVILGEGGGDNHCTRTNFTPPPPSNRREALFPIARTSRNFALVKLDNLHSTSVQGSSERAYKNLSPKTRLGVGVAVLAWGAAGLYLSDQAEEKYQPTPEEKAVVDKYVPKVTVVDRSKE